MTLRAAIFKDFLIYGAIAYLAVGAFSPARGQHCQVHVDGDGSLGSGTLVDKDGSAGLVITAGHVVRDSKQGVWVSFPGDRRRFNARVIAEDQRNDLAALVIGQPSAEPIKVSRDPAQGNLTACGFGGNQGMRPMTGPIVGQTVAQGATHPSLIIRGTVRPGDSGGGVFNSSGELVGVVWGCGDGETYLTAGEPLHVMLTQCCANGSCYSGGYRVVTQPVRPNVIVQQPSPAPQPTPGLTRSDVESILAEKLAGFKQCQCGEKDYATGADIARIEAAIAKNKPQQIDLDQLTLNITNAVSQKYGQRIVKIEQKLSNPPAPPAEPAAPQIFSYDIVPLSK